MQEKGDGVGPTCAEEDGENGIHSLSAKPGRSDDNPPQNPNLSYSLHCFILITLKNILPPFAFAAASVDTVRFVTLPIPREMAAQGRL